MKKITVILIATLLMLTFAACVGDQGDMDGDVSLPGGESSSVGAGESNNNTPGESSGNVESSGSVESSSVPTGSVDDDGTIDLPIDWFD